MPGFLRTRRRDERGAVALIVALMLTGLLIAMAMVLDFGLVRVDRQVNKSAADSAVTAGLYGLNGGDGVARPYAGVCSAIRYLRENDLRFASVTSATGTWHNATTALPTLGPTTGNGCTNPLLRAQTCNPTNRATWARFYWDGLWQGQPLQVLIQSGYDLTTEGASWMEDATGSGELTSVTADAADGLGGCNQLAVMITQNRDPGLGSLATSVDLRSSIRSVGRVESAPGGNAPAMLLLRRTGCPILSTGSSAGTSWIHVYGAESSNDRAQPGTIHADSDGSACSGGSNQNIFLGRGADGIVAYAAPIVNSSPLAPNLAQPGQITAVAGTLGFGPTSGVIRDADANAYAAAGLNEAAPGAPGPILGRPIVTRSLVDDRYLVTVRSIINSAETGIFSSGLNAGNAVSSSYGFDEVVNDCNKSGSVTGARVFVNCTANNGYKGTATFPNATTVVFNGRVAPSATLHMPFAEKVYIQGLPGGSNPPAIDLTGGTATTGVSFQMHTRNSSPAACPSGNSDFKAVLVIKYGPIKQANNSLLRLCNTTVVMMSGSPNACLPSYPYATAPAPTTTPCPTSPSVGTGQLDQTGGDVDWTAPNEEDVLTDDEGEPLPIAAGLWGDVNGPEDLAFWSESGTSGPDQMNVNGGGTLVTKGVYMVPNAQPFKIAGGATQDLFDAQYIASSIELAGANTKIRMRVDPNAAITLPKLVLVGLVR